MKRFITVVVCLSIVLQGCSATRPNETGFAIGTGAILSGATWFATKSKNKYYKNTW